jgi:hypothetical protein
MQQYHDGLWHGLEHVSSCHTWIGLDIREMVMEFRRATPGDIPAILDVQAANFIDNLDDAEWQDGFLSVELTREQGDGGQQWRPPCRVPLRLRV